MKHVHKIRNYSWKSGFQSFFCHRNHKNCICSSSSQHDRNFFWGLSGKEQRPIKWGKNQCNRKPLRRPWNANRKKVLSIRQKPKKIAEEKIGIFFLGPVFDGKNAGRILETPGKYWTEMLSTYFPYTFCSGLISPGMLTLLFSTKWGRS